MPKINRGFLLSYQANAHLYERFDVKRNITIALVNLKAIKIASFTDSTISFIMLVDDKKSLTTALLRLEKSFQENNIRMFYTLTLVAGEGSQPPLIHTKTGDQTLNSQFQKIVKDVRDHLKIYEEN